MAFPVVGIGASAGGLAAFTTFLTHVPADTGMAFVLIQHLDPRHESQLVDLLAKVTPMPVVQIDDGMVALPNRVHVIPPDAALTLSGSVLRLVPRGTTRPPMPIDGFLRALAEARRGAAIAIILSGAGSDGALGIQAVREHGGITLVQDPAEAAFDGMPASALSTGCVDVALPVEGLADEIARIAREEWVSRTVGSASDSTEDEEDAFREVIALLGAATGVDFGRYRQTMVRRRLGRRVAFREGLDLAAYVEHLRTHPGDLQALAQDLLIPVTRFFRDPEAFDALAHTAFPDLIRRAASDGTVRLWVAGCSTGEEPYSLAISFLETARHLQSPLTCQVFATDINETVLEKARRATYLENIAADVSPERLERCFTRVGHRYQLNRAIRDLCVFSRHDLLNDPPLSRMDLVSCRNVLIYLATVHRHALGVFHFALEPGGYLLLGRSETASSRPDLFEAVDQRGRLFRAREAVAGRQFPRSQNARDARRRTPAPVAPESVVSESAYEELVAANEELQSLNEELDSSKEEIESVNEELGTLNQELSSRNAALQLAHEYAQATLDTVRSALVVLDPDLRVVNANRSFYKAFGLSAGDVERRVLSEAAPECFGAPAARRLLEEIQSAEGARDDVEIELDGPGQPHRVLVVNARRFTPTNLILLSFDDVTRAREIEADRRQSQKMAAIGHLAAGVAHDFNNLLTVVLAGIYMAAQTLPEGAPARSELASATTAANRAADLTRQLLSYAGKGRFIAERVNLSTVTAQTATLLHASIPSHVHLRLDLDRHLTPLLADPSQIHQVVANLITNAIEAIGETAGSVLVRTGRQVVDRDDAVESAPGIRLRPGEYVFVEVEDSGIGMTPDVQRQMFDPFFTTKFMGRGLGLAATQGVVSRHHGAISVRSVAGRGASVKAMFPTQPGPAPEAATVEAPAVHASPNTLLVVDDEPLVLKLTQKALQSFGHRVLPAESGAQAIDLLQAHPEIAAVVLDAIMPDMNGVETLQGLHTLRPELPVLVCSAMGDAALERMFAGHRVAGFVQKPYGVQHLGEQVARVLSRSK